MADLLREWLEKTFDERPKGADWNQAWAVLLSITIFCIVKARNILSLGKKWLETEKEQDAHSRKIIRHIAWTYRSYVKLEFKLLVQNRNDQDKFLKKVFKFSKTYLEGGRFGQMDYGLEDADSENPNLILNPVHIAISPSGWSYGRVNRGSRNVGGSFSAGRYSLRPLRPGGQPTPV